MAESTASSSEVERPVIHQNLEPPLDLGWTVLTPTDLAALMPNLAAGQTNGARGEPAENVVITGGPAASATDPLPQTVLTPTRLDLDQIGPEIQAPPAGENSAAGLDQAMTVLTPTNGEERAPVEADERAAADQNLTSGIELPVTALTPTYLDQLPAGHEVGTVQAADLGWLWA